MAELLLSAKQTSQRLGLSLRSFYRYRHKLIACGLQAVRAGQRNVRRQIKGIWDYIESQLKAAKEVSPGVIFVKRPGDKERMKLIEDMFEEEGIPVVWRDESIEERKGR